MKIVLDVDPRYGEEVDIEIDYATDNLSMTVSGDDANLHYDYSANGITLALSFLFRKVFPRFTSKSKTNFDDFVLNALADSVIPFGFVVVLILTEKNLGLPINVERAYDTALRLVGTIVLIRFVNRVSSRFLTGLARRSGAADLEQLLKSLLPLVRAVVWGIGTLVGLLVAGFWLVPRLGKFVCARLGCQLILASLVLLALVGVTAQPQALKVVIFLFGLATGIGTNATLVLMLDLTLPEVAGTFVGVWGLAQAYSRAAGKVLGGGLLDLARTISPGSGPFPPYAAVFLVEAAIAVLALVLLSGVNLRQFREDTGRSLDRVLAVELG